MRETFSYAWKSKEERRLGEKERNKTSELSVINCKTYKSQHETMKVDLRKGGLAQGKVP